MSLRLAPSPRAHPALYGTPASSLAHILHQQMLALSAHKVVMMSMMGLVVLLAVGPQSVQGRTVTYENYVCTIRDSDNELVSCTGSGENL